VIRLKRFLRILAGLALAGKIQAQLPSECLLIVNGTSPDAMAVSQTYAELRNIPAERILILKPDADLFRKEDGSFRWALRESRTRRDILTPLLDKLNTLNDPFPTALLLSPDWPTRIILESQPSVSITAFLGTLGQLPAKGIKQGQAISPWYAHPPETREGSTRLKRYPAAAMPDSPVHPAAMIGVFYESLDREAIDASLRRAVAADYSRPTGTVAFVTNQDVRTKARLDQFAPASATLEAMGVASVTTNQPATLPKPLIGVMTGAAGINMNGYKGKLVPGSFAEHLTSFAATFDTPGQTKLTEWIAAGAAGSVGTVTEPFAIWTKFPRAAVFERYLSGQTLLESVTQSIASPWQSLIVGDALCRPWGEPLAGLKVETRWHKNTLHITAHCTDPDRTEFHLFLNGARIQEPGPVWRFDFPRPPAKPLELILHARYNWSPPETGSVRQQIPAP
jgi:hypothetical protein